MDMMFLSRHTSWMTPYGSHGSSSSATNAFDITTVVKNGKEVIGWNIGGKTNDNGLIIDDYINKYGGFYEHKRFSQGF